MLPTRSIFQLKDTDRLKVKEWEEFYYANIHRKKVAGSMLISDIIDFIANNNPSRDTNYKGEIKWKLQSNLFFSNLCRSNLIFY